MSIYQPSLDKSHIRPTLHAGKFLGTGNGHDVYDALSDPGCVLKVPCRFQYGWQHMTAEFAQRDLRILEEYDIPTLETTLIPEDANPRGAIIFLIRELRKRDAVRQFLKDQITPQIQVPYVLRQRKVERLSGVSYEDLKDSSIRDQVIALRKRADALYNERKLCLDLIGWSVFRRLEQSLHDPEVRPNIGNLYIDENRRVLLTDTRLFDLNEGEHWKRILLQYFFELEQEALVRILADYGVTVDRGRTQNLSTAVQRILAGHTAQILYRFFERGIRGER